MTIALLLLLVPFIALLYLDAVDIFDKNKSHKIEDKLNIVELKARFTNYQVIDKYQEDTTYYMVLLNPITEKEYEIKTNDYVYYNLYFITNTIK